MRPVDETSLVAGVARRLRGSVRWAWLIALVCTIVTTSAYLAAKAQTPVYSAAAILVYEPKLGLENPLAAGSNGVDAVQETMTVGGVAGMLGSPLVRQEAERALGSTSPTAGYAVSAGAVFLDNDSVSNTVAVTSLSSNARVAAQAANAYADALIGVRAAARLAQLRRAQRVVTAEIAQTSRGSLVEALILDHQLADLRVLSAGVADDLRVVRPAVPPAAPEQPRPLHTAVLAFVVSLIASVGLALALQEFDTSLGDASEVAEALALPLFGRVPVGGGRKADTAGTSASQGDEAVADAYRGVRASLDRARAGGDPSSSVIVVTSSLTAEDRSGTVAALAESLALTGRRVAVIDGDLHHACIHARFALPNDRGVTDVLAGRLKVADVLSEVEPRGVEGLTGEDAAGAAAPDDGAQALTVMTSGPVSSKRDGVVAPAAFRRLCAEVARHVDVVLVCAPETSSADGAAALADGADGALVLVERRRASRPMLAGLRRALASSPCRVLGVVVAG